MYTRDPIGSKKGSYKQTNRTTQVWKFCHLFQKSEMKMGYNENESECWLQLRQSRLSSPDGALVETASVAPPPPWQHPHRQPRGLAAAGKMIEVSRKI